MFIFIHRILRKYEPAVFVCCFRHHKYLYWSFQRWIRKRYFRYETFKGQQLCFGPFLSCIMQSTNNTRNNRGFTLLFSWFQLKYLLKNVCFCFFQRMKSLKFNLRKIHYYFLLWYRNMEFNKPKHWDLVRVSNFKIKLLLPWAQYFYFWLFHIKPDIPVLWKLWIQQIQLFKFNLKFTCSGFSQPLKNLRFLCYENFCFDISTNGYCNIVSTIYYSYILLSSPLCF